MSERSLQIDKLVPCLPALPKSFADLIGIARVLDMDLREHVALLPLVLTPDLPLSGWM